MLVEFIIGTAVLFVLLLIFSKKKKPEQEAISSEGGKTGDWTDEQGVRFSLDKETLLKAPANLKEYIIPDGVITIQSNAFEGCANLKCVSFPNSVKRIGRFVFNKCDSLTEIRIPAGNKERFEKMLPSDLHKIMIDPDASQADNDAATTSDKETSGLANSDQERYYFYDGRCSFKLDSGIVNSEEENGGKFILQTKKMKVVMWIIPEMPIHKRYPWIVGTEEMEVAGYHCEVAYTKTPTGRYPSYFIDCGDFVVQVNLPNQNTKEEKEFLNSFRLERKDNERLKYSALGLDNSTGAQTGPAQNMMQDPEFLYSLALTAFNSQHYEDAVKMALVAASKGSKSAENLLGACYENGYGVPVNQEMAIKFYTSSAEAGSADAQFNLGRLYYLISESKHYTKVGGMSVRIGPEPIVPYEEDVQAVKWFRKAAEQGSVKAQYSLGMCLYEGNGVERTAKNMEEGKHWLRKAAEQGFRAAEEYIAIKQI